MKYLTLNMERLNNITAFLLQSTIVLIILTIIKYS